MVDEKDERYEDEEDEYHFSDDQMNFEVENDAPKTSTEAPIPSKESFMTKMGNISPRRRALLAGIVFIVLIGIVYKMLKPSTSPTNEVLSEINTAPAEPITQPAPPPVAIVKSTPPPPVVEEPVATVVVQPTPPPAVEAKKMEDRLNTLEQQSSAMMNLLQTEYAQKISDYEMQGNLTRGKMDEMSKRISRIESNLNQITQMLREGGAATSRPEAAAVNRAEPKIGYTVQAIIPGRAWLKSESGDTVTVAEGDILRNYGRIAKIDPYDGIVEIDTGSRIIALSYGMNVE